MTSTQTCSTCGSDIPAGPHYAVCPVCSLQGALAVDASGPDVTDCAAPATHGTSGGNLHQPTRVGDYELLEEIARGGMGVVYRARQIRLDRIVAVKMILFGSLAGSEALRRFQAEASAAGSLQHPNIVAVHETGVHDGQPFIVMDYVDGPSLASLMRERPLPSQRAATYLRLIAEAVHYAHKHGVLHRDLKPSNIIIGSDDRPRLTDFGLAKRFSGESSLTLSGHTLGSPHYMPPEQCGIFRSSSELALASANEISARAECDSRPSFSDAQSPKAIATRTKAGPASDIYGLGAILYHLLTGRPPFEAETIGQLLAQVREVDPIPPRSLNPSVPPDLQTICLKCLEKEPSKRYPTAQAVAEDLGRFLNGEAIQARPVTKSERAWRWCHRHRAVAAFATASAVLLLAVLIGSPIATFRIAQSRESAIQQSQRAVLAERRALDGEAEARSALYAANMNLIGVDWERDNFARLRQLLEESRGYPSKGFEWSYWQRQTHLERKTLRGHLGVVTAVAYSADGRLVATASSDRTAKVWEASTGRELLTLKGHTEPVTSVAFSPDGQDRGDRGRP